MLSWNILLTFLRSSQVLDVSGQKQRDENVSKWDFDWSYVRFSLSTLEVSNEKFLT